VSSDASDEIDPRDREIAALRRESDALGRAIVLLHEISNLVRAAQELEPTCYALLTGVTAGVGLGMNRAAIFLCDETAGNTLRGMAAVGPMDREEADRVWRSIEADGPDLETLYEAGLKEHARPGRLDRMIRALAVDPRGQSPIGIALRRGRLVAGEGTDDLGGLLHLPTSLAAPLRGRTRIRGVLVADRRFTEEAPDSATKLVFDLLADHAGRAVENAEHFENLAREARTDPLTGLGSRRRFDLRLSEMVAAAADGAGVGLLMIDLDDFKRVNDVHGHPAGDHVLREVGRRLLGTLRAGDGYRYGGEEIAVLLSGVSGEALSGAAERIRQTITGAPFELPNGASMKIGVSIGGAVLPGRAHDAPSLLRAADDALLRAKSDGKNRARIA
jgi:diguanylate cyclase (GGDEF)-like protein